MLATYRDDEVGPAIRSRWRSATSPPRLGVERLGVVPLSVDGGTRLAVEAGSSLDPELLQESSGGKRLLRHRGSAAADSVPRTVRDAVLARTSRLSGRAQGAGRSGGAGPARRALAADEVSGCPAEAVDECVAAGLLVGDGRQWNFRHDLARLSVAETLLPTQGSALHAAALPALEAGRRGRAPARRRTPSL